MALSGDRATRLTALQPVMEPDLPNVPARANKRARGGGAAQAGTASQMTFGIHRLIVSKRDHASVIDFHTEPEGTSLYPPGTNAPEATPRLPIVLLERCPGFPHRHHGFHNTQIRHADSDAFPPLSVVTAVEALG